MERAIIIALLFLVITLCAAQLSAIGKYWLFNSLQLMICPKDLS